MGTVVRCFPGCLRIYGSIRLTGSILPRSLRLLILQELTLIETLCSKTQSPILSHGAMHVIRYRGPYMLVVYAELSTG